jgi:hypothetical protein
MQKFCCDTKNENTFLPLAKLSHRKNASARQRQLNVDHSLRISI